MHVVATAGHVDHGKSTLLRALTGTDPDRLPEERRRGLTTDLGFVWTPQRDVAFVDVPGHERFVPTMLAGVGQVTAVLLVVAADGGWMPQTSEHLDALAALGVERGLLVLTRCDLAAPQRRADVAAEARSHLSGTPLRDLPVVEVSAATGAGLDALRAALGGVLAASPRPDPAAPVRLWVDRSFTVRGAGTVVTGTLAAGTVATGDELALPDGARVGVRGLQSLDAPVASASGPSRVALNLRGASAAAVPRGTALSTPGTVTTTGVVDVRLLPAGGDAQEPAAWPEHLVLHLGTAAAPVRLRPLDGATGGHHARLSLAEPLPLRTGDRALLRDPGGHRVLAGVAVLDPAPPPLRRRGAARERAGVLAGVPAVPVPGPAGAAAELARRGSTTRASLRALGLRSADVDALAASPVVLTDGDHLLSPGAAALLRGRLGAEVAAHQREHPLEPGPALEAVRRRLDLPTTGLVTRLVGGDLAVREGRVVPAASATGPALPPRVAEAVGVVLADLRTAPWSAPEAHRLRDLGLGPRELAAAVRAGALERVADGVYLAPGAVADAATALAGLPQPFALSEARRAWGTSRRVAVPLLELLDRRGATRQLPDSTRVLRRPGDGSDTPGT